MGVKIYEAYKFKGEFKDLMELLTTIKSNTKESLIQYIDAKYQEFKESPELFKAIVEVELGEANVNDEYINTIVKNFDKSLEDRNVFYYAIAKVYEHVSKSIYRNTFDFNMSFTIKYYKGSYYIIPYYQVCGCLNLYSYEQLKDYSYWNNTDRPKSIKSREWNKRRDIWNELMDRDKILFEIMTPDIFRFEVCRKLLEEEFKKLEDVNNESKG